MDNSEPESSEDSELYEQLAGEWNPMPKRCCALIIILIASPPLSENIPLFLIHQWQFTTGKIIIFSSVSENHKLLMTPSASMMRLSRSPPPPSELTNLQSPTEQSKAAESSESPSPSSSQTPC